MLGSRSLFEELCRSSLRKCTREIPSLSMIINVDLRLVLARVDEEIVRVSDECTISTAHPHKSRTVLRCHVHINQL